MEQLLEALKAKVDHIICVGYQPVDEEKTAPKQNPLTGNTSYFWNKRVQEFNTVFKEICTAKNITFVEPKINTETWIKEYLFADGLHPNQKGHQLIYENVQKHLDGLVTI